MRKGYTFSEVCIEPVYNNVGSRHAPSLETNLCVGVRSGLPFIPANMDTVIGENLAGVLSDYGIPPIYHRFSTFEQKSERLSRVPGFMSCGINEKDVKEILLLQEKVNDSLQGVCIDIAHGHDSRMKPVIAALKENGLKVIAGNVCSEDGYRDLVEWGADAVKVGVGPGAACTTRGTTGFGVPQFSAVYEIGKQAQKLHVPFIADGGISGPDDIAKALAAGASTVMMGKMFACTEESAAEKRYDKPMLARYRGQASAEFQEEFYGGMREGTVPEGEAFWAPVTGSARALINYLSGCLRSALNYGGARDIYELQRKCRGNFWVVGDGYRLESSTRE